MNIISMDLKSISRSLAASDSQTRLEGFSRTFKYISENDLIYTDILKLWKSLFYCIFYLDLWMADKDHELISEKLASLNDYAKNKWEWIHAFFETMKNEWDGIDPIRIDKFMYLVRMILKAVLNYASNEMNELYTILQALFDKTNFKGMGLIYHVADIYLEEIPKVEFDKTLEFIQPFIKLMKSSKLNQVTDMVYQKILLKLAEKRENSLKDWAYSQASSR